MSRHPRAPLVTHRSLSPEQACGCPCHDAILPHWDERTRRAAQPWLCGVCTARGETVL